MLFRRLRQQQLLLTRRLAPGLLTWRNIDSFFASLSLSLLAILFPLTLFHPALSLHRERERDQYPSTMKLFSFYFFSFAPPPPSFSVGLGGGCLTLLGADAVDSARRDDNKFI